MAAKRGSKNYIYGIIFLALLSAATYWVVKNSPFLKKFFGRSTRRYSAFGIKVPAGYGIQGIDVSHYQQGISWDMVSNMKVNGDSISFAFIKASEGATARDNMFADNWAQAQRAHVIKGAYHYYRPSANATLQAYNFVQKVKLLPGDLPPVLDIEEDAKPATIVADALTILKIWETQYNCKPIIYASASFYKNYLNTPELSVYPFWVAHYYQAEPRTDENWVFWQHSDKGHVNGIDGDVDFNVFNGNLAQLKQLCIQKPNTAQPKKEDKPKPSTKPKTKPKAKSKVSPKK